MKVALHSLSLAIVVFLISCNNRVVPMQGTYMDQPYEFGTGSKEVAWNKLVDFFTDKGLAIKTIDKNTGLITTEPTSFLNAYTWENKNGTFSNPNAFVVCSKIRGPLTIAPSLKSEVVTGQWVVRLKEENNRTVVMTRLANATGIVIVESTGMYGTVTKQTYNLVVQSTGLFEKSIESALQ